MKDFKCIEFLSGPAKWYEHTVWKIGGRTFIIILILLHFVHKYFHIYDQQFILIGVTLSQIIFSVQYFILSFFIIFIIMLRPSKIASTFSKCLLSESFKIKSFMSELLRKSRFWVANNVIWIAECIIVRSRIALVCDLYHWSRYKLHCCNVWMHLWPY